MTAHEVTGFRDMRLSRRHRQYGSNVPAVDVDFLLVEYDNGDPAALVEYKTTGARAGWSPTHKSMNALTRLADRYCDPGHAHVTGLPFFVVFYDLALLPDPTIEPIPPQTTQPVFSVVAMNTRAQLLLRHVSRVQVRPDGDTLSASMSEVEYVQFLHALRALVAADMPLNLSPVVSAHLKVMALRAQLDRAIADCRRLAPDEEPGVLADPAPDDDPGEDPGWERWEHDDDLPDWERDEH